MKTSHSIIFHFEEHGGNFSFIEHFTFERTQNGRREEICRFDIMVDLGGDLPYEDCSSHSNRTSVILIDADKRYIIVDVIISNAEKADNGTYMIFGRRSGRTKCFTVFILGRYSLYTQVHLVTVMRSKLLSLQDFYWESVVAKLYFILILTLWSMHLRIELYHSHSVRIFIFDC